MIDDGKDSTLHDMENHEVEMKKSLPQGKAEVEHIIRSKRSFIPVETPGKDVSIRPSSPFRDIGNRIIFNNRESDSTTRDSVRVTDSVRSVYEINQRKNSPKNQGAIKFAPDAGAVPHPGGRYEADPRYDPGARYEAGGRFESVPHPPVAHPVYGTSGTSPEKLPNPPPGYYPPMYAGGGHPGVPPPGYPNQAGYPGSTGYYPYPVYYPVPPPGYHEHHYSGHHEENTMPNYDAMDDIEQQEARIIFKSKFNELKEMYPERKFDDYDPELPLRIIHTLYERHIAKVSAESNVSLIKMLVPGLFFVIELVAKNVFKIDVGDYTKQQMANMKRYESMISEFGEKWSGAGGFNFPVEIRFLIQALSGLIIVAIIKFVCNGFGWKYHDSYAKMASNYLDSTVNYFTEKPEVEVDPVTKTVNPSSRGRGVMGDIQNLMSMANSLPGVSKLGETVMNSATKGAKDPKVPAGKKTGVKFGQKK